MSGVFTVIPSIEETELNIPALEIHRPARRNLKRHRDEVVAIGLGHVLWRVLPDRADSIHLADGALKVVVSAIHRCESRKNVTAGKLLLLAVVPELRTHRGLGVFTLFSMYLAAGEGEGEGNQATIRTGTCFLDGFHPVGRPDIAIRESVGVPVVAWRTVETNETDRARGNAIIPVETHLTTHLLDLDLHVRIDPDPSDAGAEEIEKEDTLQETGPRFQPHPVGTSRCDKIPLILARRGIPHDGLGIRGIEESQLPVPLGWVEGSFEFLCRAGHFQNLQPVGPRRLIGGISGAIDPRRQGRQVCVSDPATPTLDVTSVVSPHPRIALGVIRRHGILRMGGHRRHENFGAGKREEASHPLGRGAT